jgi:SagB-type dehydrogenase family enzyme
MISELPKPNFKIIDSIWMRRSIRVYSSYGLGLKKISQVLWAAYGKNNYRRTVPSAGATYPLTIYLLDDDGISRYLPEPHALERVRPNDIRLDMWLPCLKQKAIANANVIIVIAVDYDKIRLRYKRRGERYAILEAGHVGQNIHLMCEALGLGCVMIGAFSDHKVQSLLGINEDPLYVIPIGRCQGG